MSTPVTVENVDEQIVNVWNYDDDSKWVDNCKISNQSPINLKEDDFVVKTKNM